MNRVDFHSVSAILFQYFQEADTLPQQITCLYDFCMFFPMIQKIFIWQWTRMQMDQRAVSASPRIINYYVDNAHKKAMHQDIETQLFPFLSDFANASMELKELYFPTLPYLILKRSDYSFLHRVFTWSLCSFCEWSSLYLLCPDHSFDLIQKQQQVFPHWLMISF